MLVWALVAAAAVALAVVVWQQRDRLGDALIGRSLSAQIDPARYQAVFLTGGQVFFGRLTARGDVLLLSDVFYLASTPSDETGDPGTLVKRGNELFGPEEPMIIATSQILFVENLRAGSQVVQAITRFKSGEAPTATPPPLRTPSPTPSPTRTP